jgi:hypothetical protein
MYIMGHTANIQMISFDLVYALLVLIIIKTRQHINIINDVYIYKKFI